MYPSSDAGLTLHCKADRKKSHRFKHSPIPNACPAKPRATHLYLDLVSAENIKLYLVALILRWRDKRSILNKCTYWEIIHLGRTCTCLQSPHPSTSGRFCRKVCKDVLWRCHRNQAGTWSRNPTTCRSKGNRSFYRKRPFRYRSCISTRTARTFFLFPWRNQPHKRTRILETYLDPRIWPRHLLCVCSYGHQFHLNEEKIYQQQEQQQQQLLSRQRNPTFLQRMPSPVIGYSGALCLVRKTQSTG